MLWHWLLLTALPHLQSGLTLQRGMFLHFHVSAEKKCHSDSVLTTELLSTLVSSLVWSVGNVLPVSLPLSDFIVDCQV